MNQKRQREKTMSNSLNAYNLKNLAKQKTSFKNLENRS